MEDKCRNITALDISGVLECGAAVIGRIPAETIDKIIMG